MRPLGIALTLACALSALFTSAAGSARAIDILPGFDLFETDSTGTSGVTPFGTIAFMGIPFPAINGLGTTDTIVQRFTGLPPGGTGPIPIELVALHLQSVTPVVIPPFGPVDVHAIVNQSPMGPLIMGLPPTALPPSTGTLTVLSHMDPAGGTFTASFMVNVDLILTPPGGSIDNPLFRMPFMEGQLFTPTPIPWSHTPPPGYPMNPLFPAGNFFIMSPFMEMGPLALHTIRPPTVTGDGAIPEPSSWMLLGLGVLGLMGYSWRRRRAARVS
jgi:hypothetical protein